MKFKFNSLSSFKEKSLPNFTVENNGSMTLSQVFRVTNVEF